MYLVAHEKYHPHPLEIPTVTFWLRTGVTAMPSAAIAMLQ